MVIYYTGKKMGIPIIAQSIMKMIDIRETAQPPKSIALRLSLLASPIGAIIFEPG